MQEPGKSNQRDGQCRSEVESPCGDDLEPRKTEEVPRAAVVEEVQQLSFIELAHDQVAIRGRGMRLAPDKIRRHRISIAVHFIGHFQGAAGYDLVVVSSPRSSQSQSQG